jgi:ribosomal protein S30
VAVAGQWDGLNQGDSVTFNPPVEHGVFTAGHGGSGTCGGMTGCRRSQLPRIGANGCCERTPRVRGIENYRPAVRADDFRPGTIVDLVREPGIAYDTNAVAPADPARESLSDTGR